MKECCMNCKFYSDLKISERKVKPIERNNIITGFRVEKNGSRFERTHCCSMFIETEKEHYFLEVEPMDFCEMFTKKVGVDNDN